MVVMKRAGSNSVILVDPLLSPCSVRWPGDWPRAIRAIGVAIWAIRFSWPGVHWGRG